MNEFIENLQNFREWLFDLSVVTPDEAALLNRIKDKWEEFDLNSCFSDNDYEDDSQQGRNKNNIFMSKPFNIKKNITYQTCCF